MRGFLITLVVMLVLMGIIHWLRQRSPQSPEAAPAATPSVAPVAVTPPQPRKELFTAPRASISPAPSAGVSPECARFWNELRGLDLAQADVVLPSAAGCGKLPPDLTRWQERYNQACKDRRTPECNEVLYGYRAALTESLTRQTPLGEISDPKVLTDKMVARLMQDGSSGAAVAEVAERLLQIEPDMPQAARAAAASRLSAAQQAAGKPDDPQWKKVDEALDQESRTMDADPRSYYEATLYAQNLRYLDPDRLREKATEIGKARPELGVGPYYQAWAEFDKGNREKAVELCQEASRREPGDPRFRACAQGLPQGGGNPFQVNLSFNITPR